MTRRLGTLRMERRAALAAALGAVGLWAWILATGGIVRHPPRKLDRPATGAVAPSPEETRASRAASSDERANAVRPAPASAVSAPPLDDPRARLDSIARRIDALEAERAPRRGALDAAFSGAFAANEAPVPALDEITARFLADAPFEGVRARAGLRVASFGGRLFVEGEELVAGALRLARVDSGGVVLAGPAGAVRLSAPAQRTEGAR